MSTNLDPVSEVMALHDKAVIAANRAILENDMDAFREAGNARAALEAKVRELEKDAARIEWCESRCYFPEYCSHGSVGWYIDGTGIQQMPTARAAIDVALSAQKPEASNGR